MAQRKFSDLPRIAELDKMDILPIERADGTKQVSFLQLCKEIAVQEIARIITEFPEIETDDDIGTIAGKINKWHKDAVKKIEGISDDILDSKEEIEANTEPGKFAGAQALKEMFGEINSNLSRKFILQLFSMEYELTANKISIIDVPITVRDGYTPYCINFCAFTGSAISTCLSVSTEAARGVVWSTVTGVFPIRVQIMYVRQNN